MSRFEKALSMAMEAHQGQVDKAGEPYLKHVLRVAMSFDVEELQIVGLLHDILEDSDLFTVRDLSDLFGPRIAAAVILLTRKPGTPYRKYILGLRGHPLAHPVKLIDLYDHLGDTRYLTNEQEKKYLDAAILLGEVEDAPVKVACKGDES